MTIYDIAKLAGVSASTVSRVVNHKPGIHEETRKRVEKLLKEYNYTPDEAARGLVAQSTRIIGILIEDIRIAHHTESAYIIEQEMTKLGYTCITLSTGPSAERKSEYIKILEQRRVEGAILMGSMFGVEEVRQSILKHLPGIPVAVVNGYLDLPNVYGALIDERGGMQELAAALIARGRKNLAFAMDVETPSNLQKRAGFLTALREAGIEEDGLSRVFDSFSDDDEGDLEELILRGRRVTSEILEKNPKVEGILYSVDLLAIGGLEELKARGIRVPEQVAVTGVDNTLYGKICSPKLTTLDNKLVEVSQTASEMLLRALEKKTGPHKMMLFTEIIERETT